MSALPTGSPPVALLLLWIKLPGGIQNSANNLICEIIQYVPPKNRVPVPKDISRYNDNRQSTSHFFHFTHQSKSHAAVFILMMMVIWGLDE